jgi:hypothetical protein
MGCSCGSTTTDSLEEIDDGDYEPAQGGNATVGAEQQAEEDQSDLRSDACMLTPPDGSAHRAQAQDEEDVDGDSLAIAKPLHEVHRDHKRDHGFYLSLGDLNYCGTSSPAEASGRWRDSPTLADRFLALA